MSVLTKVQIQEISQKENILENGYVAGENIEFHFILDNNQANRLPLLPHFLRE